MTTEAWLWVPLRRSVRLRPFGEEVSSGEGRRVCQGGAVAGPRGARGRPEPGSGERAPGCGGHFPRKPQSSGVSKSFSLELSALTRVAATGRGARWRSGALKGDLVGVPRVSVWTISWAKRGSHTTQGPDSPAMSCINHETGLAAPPSPRLSPESAAATAAAATDGLSAPRRARYEG